MYDYEDYKFVVTVKVNGTTVSLRLPYSEYQTALDAAQGIIDAEAVTGDKVYVLITLVGINYKGDGTPSCITDLNVLHDQTMYI